MHKYTELKPEVEVKDLLAICIQIQDVICGPLPSVKCLKLTYLTIFGKQPSVRVAMIACGVSYQTSHEVSSHQACIIPQSFKALGMLISFCFFLLAKETM